MKAYIYGIKNLINNKVYIGSTKSPEARRRKHFYDLKVGKHHSFHLQRSYNKYGKDKFAFYVIEECPSGERQKREVYHITSSNSFNPDKGYNVYEPNGDNFKCSESTKSKIRKTKLQIPIDLYRLDGTFICAFDNLTLCERYLNFSRGILSAILKGKRKSFKGYTVVKSQEPFSYTRSKMTRDMTKLSKN